MKNSWNIGAKNWAVESKQKPASHQIYLSFDYIRLNVTKIPDHRREVFSSIKKRPQTFIRLKDHYIIFWKILTQIILSRKMATIDRLESQTVKHQLLITFKSGTFIAAAVSKNCSEKILTCQEFKKVSEIVLLLKWISSNFYGKLQYLTRTYHGTPMRCFQSAHWN